MEGKYLKKYLKLIFTIQIFILLFFYLGFFRISSAHAFFEEQVKYGFVDRWLQMLSDTSPEKRFHARQAFLTYPEWGLPVLRNSIKNPGNDYHSWQFALLIGMLGNASDIPILLKKWRQLEKQERSEVWLGAMQRLYWKNYVPSEIIPKLKRISVNPLINFDEEEKEGKKVNLLYLIENPAPIPRFVRVTLQLWQTLIQEKIPEKYFYIPAGGSLKSKIPVRILPLAYAKNIRLDFRIWEVGVPKPMLHQTVSIPSVAL